MITSPECSPSREQSADEFLRTIRQTREHADTLRQRLVAHDDRIQPAVSMILAGWSGPGSTNVARMIDITSQTLHSSHAAQARWLDEEADELTREQRLREDESDADRGSAAGGRRWD
ncbi:MAG: hypothetical protein LBV06_00555 [Propionibacteriaceae bacterium]|jgi:hypothetical protein|nr:hypothetical protein [Propionibacteriaceae bacterium]